MRGPILVVIVGLLLAGCSKSKPVHSEKWYETHAAQREADRAACRSDVSYSPAENCQNAERAHARMYLLARAAAAGAAAATEAAGTTQASGNGDKP